MSSGELLLSASKNFGKFILIILFMSVRAQSKTNLRWHH
jgi:hypothetical protein